MTRGSTSRSEPATGSRLLLTTSQQRKLEREVRKYAREGALAKINETFDRAGYTHKTHPRCQAGCHMGYDGVPAQKFDPLFLHHVPHGDTYAVYVLGQCDRAPVMAPSTGVPEVAVA